jgi:hypothetical protein
MWANCPSHSSPWPRSMSPSKHKSPLLGWHPPADLAAWARDEAERQEVPLSRILTAALDIYRAFCEADPRPVPKGIARGEGIPS